MIRFFYGKGDICVDVTEAVFRNCFDGERIAIPRGDVLRANLLADPLPGVVKDIIVVTDTDHGQDCEIIGADREFVRPLSQIDSPGTFLGARSQLGTPPVEITSLAIAITFLYRPDRLEYLSKVTAAHLDMARDSTTFVVTNTSDQNELRAIRQAVSANRLEIITPTYLGHPYLLTWAHRAVFWECLERGEAFSHYLYTEDDLLLTKANIDYWLRGVTDLAPYDCIPGFVRYEINVDGEMVSSDALSRIDVGAAPKTQLGRQLWINSAYPYQGLYLLSERHIRELLFTFAGNPDHGRWEIREKAAQGLTYWGAPPWAESRYFIGLTEDLAVDPGALFHHLPNNYAVNPHTGHGKILMSDLFKV